jgi:hypothetical protein
MEETMTGAAAQPEAYPSPMTPADRKAAGKRLRERVPRDSHAGWRAHAHPYGSYRYPARWRCDPATGLHVQVLKAAVRAGVAEPSSEDDAMHEG